MGSTESHSLWIILLAPQACPAMTSALPGPPNFWDRGVCAMSGIAMNTSWIGSDQMTSGAESGCALPLTAFSCLMAL